MEPSTLRPDEIPEGFSAFDPTDSARAGVPSSLSTSASATGGASQTPAQTSTNAAQEEQRRAILEQALTPEALARLGTIKLVKPEKASAVEGLIASMAMRGQIQARINEGKLIEMLEGIGAKQSKTAGINIHRKKYAFDSDDSEDDNDDDLL